MVKFSVHLINDGYFDLDDAHATCFLWKGYSVTGTVSSTTLGEVSPGDSVLAPAQGLTVPCTPRNPFPNMPFVSMDLAIVVSYRPRPWPFTLFRQRKFFRFLTRPNNGTVVWDEQAPGLIERDFDSSVGSKAPNFQ